MQPISCEEMISMTESAEKPWQSRQRYSLWGSGVVNGLMNRHEGASRRFSVAPKVTEKHDTYSALRAQV